MNAIRAYAGTDPANYPPDYAAAACVCGAVNDLTYRDGEFRCQRIHRAYLARPVWQEMEVRGEAKGY